MVNLWKVFCDGIARECGQCHSPVPLIPKINDKLKKENMMLRFFICPLVIQPKKRKLQFSIESNLEATYKFCSSCRWQSSTHLSLPALLEGYLFPRVQGSSCGHTLAPYPRTRLS